MTTTTHEWQAKWVWPVGTRVRFNGFPGTVIKENSTTVAVDFDAEPLHTRLRGKRIRKTDLERIDR